MKRIIAPIALAMLISIPLPGNHAQPNDPCDLGTKYKGCAACGKAQRIWVKQLNVLKNRDDNPSTIDQSVTLKEIAKKANNNVFTTDQGVEVIGFVASVQSGGYKESCNCARTDLRDIHINLVTSKSYRYDETKYIIAEITPRWQERLGVDLASVKSEIEGKWVKFRGWMLYRV